MHVPRSATIEIHYIYRNHHPNFQEENAPTLRYTLKWDAADRPTLLYIAAVAQTVSTLEASYHLYATQCIWYALTIFYLVSPNDQDGVYRVVFTQLESAVRRVIKKPDITRYFSMLRENLEKRVQPSIAGPSTFQVGLVVRPTIPLPSEVAVSIYSSTDLSAVATSSTSVATDSFSRVESATTIPTPIEIAPSHMSSRSRLKRIISRVIENVSASRGKLRRN